jgi:hypothetical protein
VEYAFIGVRYLTVAVVKARVGIAGSYLLGADVTTKNVGSLTTYRAKRKTSRAREAFGARRLGSRRFVGQRHAARLVESGDPLAPVWTDPIDMGAAPDALHEQIAR